MRTLHHPPTRAALNLPGLCPVCGETASRKVVCENGLVRETYRCAIDGETEYQHGDAMSIRIAGASIDDAFIRHTDGFLPLEAIAGA